MTLTQSVAGDVGYMLCFSSGSGGENYATRNDDFRLVKGGVVQDGRPTCHRSVIKAGQTNTATGDLIGIRVLGDTRVEPDEKIDVEIKPLIYLGDGRNYGNNVPYDYTDRSQMKYGVRLTAANTNQSFTIMNDDQPRAITRPPPKPLYHHSIVVHSDADSEDPGRRITNSTRRQIRVQLFKNPNYNIQGQVLFKFCLYSGRSGTATRDQDGAWDAGDDYRLLVRGSIVNGQCRTNKTFGSDGFSSDRIEIDVRNDKDVEPDETVIFTVELLSEAHKNVIQVHNGTYTIRNDDFGMAEADPEVTINKTGGAVDEGELASFRVKVAQPPGTQRPPGTPKQYIKVAARVPWSDQVWTTTIITPVLGGNEEWFEVPTNGVTGGDYQLCAWVLPGDGYTPGGTSGNAPTSGSSCPSGHTVLVHAAQSTVKSSGDSQDGSQSDDGNDGNVEDDGGTETGNTPPQPDYSELKATVRGYAGETQHGDDHVNRWKRVLAGLGDEDAIAGGYSPMTAAEAQDMADTFTASRWNPIVEALTDLESRRTAEPEPEPEPDPIPALSLSGGSAVDEGASASFTIHANPAPASDVTVSFTVAQSGDWLDSPGAGTRAVTLAAGATTASLAVATVNDSADEPDGSVSVTLDTGTGYTVASSPNDTASVTVRDDDPPPPPPAIAQGTCVSVAQWNTVKGYYDSNANRSPNYGANWYRVLIAYQQDRTDQTLPDWEGATAEPAAAFTAAAAETEESKWVGWTPVRIVLQCLEKTYGGISTDSVIGGIPTMGQSGEVGTANPGGAMKRNRWNPETGPRGFEPNAMADFAAGSCVSPRLRSEAAARANETWRGASHVERWLRVGQTFSGGANDATVVTPAEAHFHAAAGQPGWLPVADALRCMEQQSLREALSR